MAAVATENPAFIDDAPSYKPPLIMYKGFPGFDVSHASLRNEGVVAGGNPVHITVYIHMIAYVYTYTYLIKVYYKTIYT